MRYIKTFNESNTDEYYSEINVSEWQKLIGIDENGRYGSNIESFTDKEKSEIQNWWNMRGNQPHDLYWGGKTQEGSILAHVNLTIKKNGKYLISKCKDEWFAVWYQPDRNTFNEFGISKIKQYKCDQLDGLKQFINDVILKTI